MARESITPVLVLAGALGLNMLNIGLVLGEALGENRANAPERVEDVQQHNAQIYEQLASDYTDGDLGRLILNDETDTYEFHLTPESTEPQVCTGEYSVTDGVAEITGTIACTTTTEVAQVGGN
jgi:hypothetical protein